MSDFNTQLAKIETLLLSSNPQPEKSLGYSTLLYFQEQSSEQPLAIESLAKRLCSLLLSIISDISDDDEEIVAQALKCLGFMIYHPSLVAAIPGDVAVQVVESLVRLITTTKIKAICNLGVWCISMQQFSASFLASHFHSLLRAVVLALENPIGSLSTTFEAIQAVMKLAAQLSEKMRDTSHIWVPVIYRRLLSIDKRERDMAERCLLKTRSVLFPPPLSLSKVIVADIRKKFLSEMKEMLQDHGRKINTIQAWGWFIRLLGSHALKNRHLVNEMLKVPEKTFSDSDPQVQIASQVAWEGLIDALIHPPMESAGTKIAPEHAQSGNVSSDRCKGNYNEKAYDFSKSIRLIMTPLVGIMSSKCDISVRSSCLNTWCYLLHNLDLSVNYPWVVETVIEPILEAVFNLGPNDKNIWPWNFCLDLLDEFILSNCKYRDYGSNCQGSSQLLTKASSLGSSDGAKYSYKDYSIKWLPWDPSKLDFLVKMIRILINQRSMITLNLEFRSLACNAGLRIFRSVLKGIQIELTKPSVDFKEIMLCLNTILSLTKQVYEDSTSKEFGNDDFLHISIQFIEVVRVELEPLFLSSPLYSVALNLKYIDNLQPITDGEHPKVPEIISIKYMGNVTPIVYLTVLHLCIMAESMLNSSQIEPILHGFKNHLEFLSSSYDPLQNLYAFISLLYKHRTVMWLRLWMVIANCLKEYIDVNDTSSLKIGREDSIYVAVCWFLSYPFVVSFFPQKLLTVSKTSSSQELCSASQLEIELVIEVWKLLYVSLNCLTKSDCFNMNGFPEDLCGILNKVLKDNSIDGSNALSSDDKIQELIFLLRYGEVAISLLNQLIILGDEDRSSSNKVDFDYSRSSGIRNTLDFTSRFLRISLEVTKGDQCNDLSAISSLFSALACFVDQLRVRQDILLFVEIFSEALVQWLSRYATMHVKMQEGSIGLQLQLLWTRTLSCLQRSQPPIGFNSSFLKVQALALETTLDHPNSIISESSIVFWNNTYGNEKKLDFPQSLLPVLDKLSRRGTINICKRSPPLSVKGHFREVISTVKLRVTATQNRNTKRVEFTKDMWDDFEYTQMLMSGTKKRRLELTEHQKEVRRAQQGRERDCNGHGPGVRTYSSLDFSQGNEDSQESQEIRNPEAILEMLKKAR